MSERSATFDNARASQVRPDQAAAGYESPALCYVRMGKLLQEKKPLSSFKSDGMF